VNVLSGIEVPDLVAALRTSDVSRLTRVPGVGKKTAERVTLELKDKLEDLAIVSPAGGTITGAVAEDVLSALVNLGYQRAAAQRAIEAAVEKDAAAKDSFEALFRAAMVAIR